MSDPRVSFRTNLDEAKRFVWDLNDNWKGGVPSVGHEIEFKLNRGRRVFTLRVVAVTWEDNGRTAGVELHMSQPGMSIRDWIEWFKRLQESAHE